jgi:TetR/AcrR family transcriptional regulator, cholesterol catabolism regulator
MEMKDRIQEKANDLFTRYGFKSITMDEIASQLGVSKKTIYQYFSDKNELVDAVVRKTINYAQSVCDSNIATCQDAVHELFQAMDFIQEIFSDMNPVMMYDLERFHPESYKLFLDHKNIYLFEIIKSNIKRGIEEGLYRPDLNIEIIARYRLEAMMLGFNQDVFPASKFNLAEAQKMIIEHFLFGVASLKGYNLILTYQKERIKSKEHDLSS